MKARDTLAFTGNTYEYETRCNHCRKDAVVLLRAYVVDDDYILEDDELKKGLRTGVHHCKACNQEYTATIKLLSYGH